MVLICFRLSLFLFEMSKNDKIVLKYISESSRDLLSSGSYELHFWKSIIITDNYHLENQLWKKSIRDDLGAVPR